jgi:Haemolymph juvenile hormone binding protein (JHBP)
MCFSFFDLTIAGLIMRFELNIPTMNIRGFHSTSAQLIGIQAPVDGNGNFNMNINNVQVSATAQLRNLPNGNLNMVHLVSNVRIASAVAELTGFGALDRTISRMISASAPGLVADNQDKINGEVQRVLIPGLNRFLNNHNINSLVNIMASRTQNPPPRSCFGPNPRICPV